MFHRSLADELLARAREYPVITLTEPRQAGKTTLARAIFKKKPYLNLEQPDTRRFAESDPNAFLAQIPDGGVIDEVQHCPHLLSYIQVIVDETPGNGRFVLAGSHQLMLHQSISQSLAGRTALLTLVAIIINRNRATADKSRC